MNLFRCSLLTAIAATTLFAGSPARAETITIPWSAAMQTNQGPDQCPAYFPYMFGSIGNECYVSFPLTIPVGRTIQQITVVRMTDNTFPGGQPFFYALLDISTLVPAASDVQKFGWTSGNAVPSGFFEKHALMAQVGKVYPDQFAVAPYTIYQVLVGLANGAGIGAIEVTYNN